MEKKGLVLLIFTASIFLSLFSGFSSANVITVNDTYSFGFTSLYDSSYSKNNDSTNVIYGTEQTAFIYHYRGFIDFNTSSIPDNAIINDVDLNYTIGTLHNTDPIYVRNLAQRAEEYASAQDLHEALGSASNITSVSAFASTGEKTIGLSTVKTDLQNKLSADWFSVGIATNETEIGDDNYDVAQSPKLIIDYTPITIIDSCQSLISANTYYQLNQSVNSSGTCFSINASNITLDCNGFLINYSQGGLGYGVDIPSGNNSITVMNCNITEGTSTISSYGIRILSSSNDTIFNNTITTFGEWGFGIFLNLSSSLNIISNNLINTSQNMDSHGIYLYLSSNNTVSNNIIVTNYNGGYGISLESASNNAIINNSIATYDSAGRGIYLKSNSIFNAISKNNITTSGLNAHGIYLKSNSIFNAISNNTIMTSGTTGYGIYSESVSNNTFSGNTITTNGNSAHSVYLKPSSNTNIFSNNTIIASGDSSYGIYLVSSSSNTFSKNAIATSGNSGFGVFLSVNSDSNNLSNNMITTSGSYTGLFGIYLDSSSNNNLSSNMVVTSNADSWGIVLASGANSNIISNNTIMTSGTTGYGFFIVASANSNAMSNNMITTFGTAGRGIYLKTSDSNTFSNGTITTSGTSGHGILMEGAGLNTNTLSGLVIRTNNSGAYPIYLYDNVPKFTMTDSILNASYSGVQELYVRSAVTDGEWNFTNVTRSDGTPITVDWTTGSGTLNVMWYLNAYANYSNVNITSWDINNALKFSELTGASGIIVQQSLMEYMQNGTGGATKTYYSNYTFNATKAGFTEESQSWNMTTNRNLVFTLTAGDTSPPEISISYPSSISPIESSVSTFLFNFTAADPSGVNDSTAAVAISKSISKTNSSCTANVINPTTTRYDCAVDMNYYDEAGAWSINASVCDNLGKCGYNDTESFTYNQLKAFTVNTSSVNLSTFYLYDLEKTDSIELSNTGNVNVTEINVTAYDLIGQSDNSYKLDSAFFSVKYDAGIYAYLINATAVTMPSASLYTYPSNLLNTVFRLEPALLPKTTKSQAYQNNAGEEWAISI
jgi:parallel beta-helix repeat protein